jgi:hypothetical protein
LAHDFSGFSVGDVDDILYEPVSRPTRDESPFGMCDGEGSVLEWCVGASDSDIILRRPWRGGVARSQGPGSLMSARRGEGYPNRIGANDGFRVVAWKRPSR